MQSLSKVQGMRVAVAVGAGAGKAIEVAVGATAAAAAIDTKPSTTTLIVLRETFQNTTERARNAVETVP